MVTTKTKVYPASWKATLTIPSQSIGRPDASVAGEKRVPSTARTADWPRPYPRSRVTPRTCTAPEEETRRRTDTVPSIWSFSASAVYCGRGLYKTFGADASRAVAGVLDRGAGAAAI